ncbi:MAG: hypothetical protein HYY85_14040 [Deltaproteobacteria bacterium]|nr:hypothetical protein [Deltaproteobacteria bacterium]
MSSQRGAPPPELPQLAPTEHRLPKDSVHYRPGKKERRCGNCTAFQPELRGCSRVAGEIEPPMVCDQWSSLKHVHRLR